MKRRLPPIAVFERIAVMGGFYDKYEALGDQDHIEVVHSVAALQKRIFAKSYPAQRELIEEARDSLTDILQWIEKNEDKNDV